MTTRRPNSVQRPSRRTHPPPAARSRRCPRRRRHLVAGDPRGMWRQRRRQRLGRLHAGTRAAPAGGGGGGSALFFENWPAYIDPTEDGATGTVDRFSEATGIDMRYTEAYNDNNEYFAKIQPIARPTASTIDPDIIAPTGWMAGRLITLGWLDKLPLDQIPNAANLRADLQNAAWDPTGEYSLPWQTGLRRHRLQHRRHRPRARRASTTCSTPSSPARSARSPRCATRSACWP